MSFLHHVRALGLSAAWRIAILTASACGLTPALSAPSALDLATQPCWVAGIRNEVRCGQIKRPLAPDGKTTAAQKEIAIHFVVIPAVARQPLPDPIFLFAGGPGQSAIALAPTVAQILERFSNRRDLVFIDQRGVGQSAPLTCPDEARLPLAERADVNKLVQRLETCRQQLERLPYGDLRQFTTTLAMQDVDAVRATLGYAQINAVGASYGTRAVLEYLRLFPAQVRRAVIDGVAPPDLGMPFSIGIDTQAALAQLFSDCQADTVCQKQFPDLPKQWRSALDQAGKTIAVRDDLGHTDTLLLTRAMILNLVRGPLYTPTQASALPYAISEAAQGHWTALAGLSGGHSDPATRLAWGMHLSVVCAEDFATEPVAADLAPEARPFVESSAWLYRRACPQWPKGTVADAFKKIEASRVPVLVLSGGSDPVTPPRHGERVAKALGSKARHVIAPRIGHGLFMQGCGPEVLYQFINDRDEAAALKADTQCLQRIPRPSFFVPRAVLRNQAATQ